MNNEGGFRPEGDAISMTDIGIGDRFLSYLSDVVVERVGQLEGIHDNPGSLPGVLIHVDTWKKASEALFFIFSHIETRSESPLLIAAGVASSLYRGLVSPVLQLSLRVHPHPGNPVMNGEIILTALASYVNGTITIAQRNAVTLVAGEVLTDEYDECHKNPKLNEVRVTKSHGLYCVNGHEPRLMSQAIGRLLQQHGTSSGHYDPQDEPLTIHHFVCNLNLLMRSTRFQEPNYRQCIRNMLKLIGNRLNIPSKLITIAQNIVNGILRTQCPITGVPQVPPTDPPDLLAVVVLHLVCTEIPKEKLLFKLYREDEKESMFLLLAGRYTLSYIYEVWHRIEATETETRERELLNGMAIIGPPVPQLQLENVRNGIINQARALPWNDFTLMHWIVINYEVSRLSYRANLAIEQICQLL